MLNLLIGYFFVVAALTVVLFAREYDGDLDWTEQFGFASACFVAACILVATGCAALYGIMLIFEGMFNLI